MRAERVDTMRAIALVLLATPVWATEKTVPTEITTAELMNFTPGGVVRLENSYGDLHVTGWDRPEVEVIVTKSIWKFRKPGKEQEAMRRLEAVKVEIKRTSETELMISTIVPSRRLLSSSPWSPNNDGGVTVEYEIHVPRQSKLVVHHRPGRIFINDVEGDIDATSNRGDILLMLRDDGSYSFDTKSAFGIVTSDFEGDLKMTRFRVGERYVASNSEAPRKIHLRMGFGGITIKAVSPLGYVPSGPK